MSQQSLHLSAYRCAKCQGPVVGGWFGKRESSISKEAKVGRLAAVCLSCGDKPAPTTEAVALRDFPPVAWPAAASPADQSLGRTTG